jgi:DNA invertase Pin-like site-specific DNA recombinase|nr:recombinase family protein [uncultured Alistipes sp.]
MCRRTRSTVCALEISRLGRNTLEALKVIQLLDENGICLYVRNYNLETIIDGKINPVASLICTILLEIAQMERHTIAERMASGRKQYIAKCRAEGVKMGRSATYKKPDDKMKIQYPKEIIPPAERAIFTSNSSNHRYVNNDDPKII